MSLKFSVIYNCALIWEILWNVWKLKQTLSTPDRQLRVAVFSDRGSRLVPAFGVACPSVQAHKASKTPGGHSVTSGAETVYMNDANSISPISEVNQWKDRVRSLKHYKNNPLQVSLGD